MKLHSKVGATCKNLKVHKNLISCMNIIFIMIPLSANWIYKKLKIVIIWGNERE